MVNKMRISFMGHNYETIMANKIGISLERLNVRDMVVNQSKHQKGKRMKWDTKVLRGVGIFFANISALI